MSQLPRHSQIRFPVDPRMVPAVKAARRLHLTEAEFERILPRLLLRGFPRADPDIGNYDLKAIDAWLDAQMGVVVDHLRKASAQAIIEERLRLLAEGKIGPRTRKQMQAEKAAKAAQKALSAKPES